MTTLLFETPTETIPAPSKLIEPAAITPDETDEVVLPTANIDNNGLVAAVETETIKTPEFAAVAKPTEAIPAPLIEKLPSVPTADDEADVVLPRANMLFAVPEATGGVTDSIKTPELAAVEKPAEIPPVADTARLVRVPTADDD